MIGHGMTMGGYAIDRLLRTLWFSMACVLGLSACSAIAQPAPAADTVTADPTARLIQVPFPLDGLDDHRIQRQLEQLLEEGRGNTRPIVILQFTAATKNAAGSTNATEPLERVGRGTSFERALSLARFLCGPQGTRIRSVAYLPQSIEGHACLVALACEEIAMHPQHTMGQAAIDETTLDQTIRTAYQDIAARRQTFPPAAVEALVDAEKQLFRLGLLGGGDRFVFESELEAIRKEGAAWSENRVSEMGQPNRFTGAQMRSFQWVQYLVSDESQLIQALRLKQRPQEAALPSGPWKPLVVRLHGRVHTRTVNHALRAIEESRRTDNTNLVIIDLDSPGGDLGESLRLAHHLAELDPSEVQTVAWVSQAARGDAAIIALSCDALFMGEGAIVGGPGDASIEPEQIFELRQSFETLSKQTGRPSGLLYGAACPALKVYEFRHPSGQEEIAAPEIIALHPQGKDWIMGKPIAIELGITSESAQQLGILRGVAPALDSIGKLYGIDDLPDAKEGSRIDRFIQRLVEQSWLPGLLMFVGCVAFMAEMSTPGATLPGFISALSFLLFFWISFLNGTVEWLEIILFVGGFVFLGIELFVIPGFGVVGLGGLFMIAAGLILASQTFVLPTNPYQLNQMAWNMSKISGAFLGVLVTIFIFRKQLESLPMFRWLALSPGGVEDTSLLEERESIVHWDHLRGKAGVTTTRCNPSGKAKIGDDVVNVISNGLMIQEDVPVRVVEVRGNTVVVEEI